MGFRIELLIYLKPAIFTSKKLINDIYVRLIWLNNFFRCYEKKNNCYSHS